MKNRAATKIEISKVCLSTDYGKTMCLLRVRRVISKSYRDGPRILEIMLDGGLSVLVTPLHAFSSMQRTTDLPLPAVGVLASDLRVGDLIWVDVPMFLGDGMLRKRDYSKAAK